MSRRLSKRPSQVDTGSGAVTISTLPVYGQLETVEQRRGFELLRLAFFVLKLRKLEQPRARAYYGSEDSEYSLRCSLLRHAIFQQVLTLTSLGARDQAMQLIDACKR